MLSKLYNSAKQGIGGAVRKTGSTISDLFSNRQTIDLDAYRAEQEQKQPNLREFHQPQQYVNNRYQLSNRGANLTDEDFDKMRPLIYGEVSNRDYDKKQMEADVIFNTAINRQPEYKKRGKDMSIADIVAMPNQYQAYGSDQYQTYYNPKNPIDVAKKKEVDAIVDAIAEKIRRGEYIDSTEGAFYYIHNDDSTITYDNLRPLFK